MRGDPEYDEAIDAMYRRQDRARKRRLRWVQAIAVLLGLVAVILIFLVEHRAVRVATIPYILMVVWLRLLDPDWLSLNQKFTIGLIAAVLVAYLLKLLLMLLS